MRRKKHLVASKSPCVAERREFNRLLREWREWREWKRIAAASAIHPSPTKLRGGARLQNALAIARRLAQKMKRIPFRFRSAIEMAQELKGNLIHVCIDTTIDRIVNVKNTQRDVKRCEFRIDVLPLILDVDSRVYDVRKFDVRIKFLNDTKKVVLKYLREYLWSVFPTQPHWLELLRHLREDLGEDLGEDLREDQTELDMTPPIERKIEQVKELLKEKKTINKKLHTPAIL